MKEPKWEHPWRSIKDLPSKKTLAVLAYPHPYGWHCDPEGINWAYLIGLIDEKGEITVDEEFSFVVGLEWKIWAELPPPLKGEEKIAFGKEERKQIKIREMRHEREFEEWRKTK